MAKAKTKSAAEKRSLSIIQSYKQTFETIHGKKVLWDLMKVSGMLSNGFVPGDSHATAYNEGGRQVALHILQKLNVNIERLEKMIEDGEKQEHNIYE